MERWDGSELDESKRLKVVFRDDDDGSSIVLRAPSNHRNISHKNGANSLPNPPLGAQDRLGIVVDPREPHVGRQRASRCRRVELCHLIESFCEHLGEPNEKFG